MLAYIADLFNLKNLLITLLIFLPLERLLPMHPAQKIFRKSWKNDLVYAVFNGLIIQAGLVVVILGALLVRQRVPQLFRAALSGQPLSLQFVEVLVIADLGFYAAHRMFHRIPFLWRIHQIHHSIEHLDWLAGTRVHPADQIITKGVSLAPIFILGYSPEAVAAFGLLYQWQSIFLHSNLRIGFGPLRLLVASPKFHHWHHCNEHAAHDKNFAGQLPLLDVLFGTLHLPAGMVPQSYGIDQKIPQSFIPQLLHPLMPQQLKWAPMAMSPPMRTSAAMIPESRTRPDMA
ncbi:sterol desaturase family protein [Rhodopila sp.]|uniref:sterol desaturase family protein n=1 Tax=Rhodopila sp. TaxID=2480087 RepID=UPI003D152B72